MSFIDPVLVIIKFFLLYQGLRPITLRRHKFKCLRCGCCCGLKVKLSKEDVLRLEKAGKSDFVVDKDWLKRVDGVCVFRESSGGMARCSVYESRPKICTWWPAGRLFIDVRCKFYSGKYL